MGTYGSPERIVRGSILRTNTQRCLIFSNRLSEIAARLRDHAVPVIGYVARGSLKLDLRTIFPRQDAELIAAIRAVCR